MKTKVGGAIAFFLLNICFVTSASIRTEGVAECVGPNISTLAENVDQTVELGKEIVKVVNETLSSLKACFKSATKTNSSRGSTGQSLSTCLTILYAKAGPEVQDVMEKYKVVIPSLEKTVDALASCIDGAPISPSE